MNHSYTLVDFIKLVFKHIVVILLCGIVFGGLLGGYAKLKKTTSYTATREMVIGHDLDTTKIKDKNSRLLADMQMLTTYEKVAKDTAVLKKATKIYKVNYNKKISESTLDSAVEVTHEPQTLILSVKAESTSDLRAVRMTNAVSQAIKKELPKLYGNTGNIDLLSPATKSNVSSTSGPSVKKYGTLGVAVGLFVGLLFVFGKFTLEEFSSAKQK